MLTVFTAQTPLTPMVLLIGNFPPDQQQSMQHFSEMMLRDLRALGIAAELVCPEAHFVRIVPAPFGFIRKWAGYIDKLFIFPRRLRKLRGVELIHICDHSNAIYAKHFPNVPVVVTCHDLLAVRGALGEETDCPASLTGKILQRWILRGLRHASVVACVSQATEADARRLVSRGAAMPKIELARLGLNYPFHKLPEAEISARLANIPNLHGDVPFVVHVGSNLRRKNRDGVLRIFSRCKEKWNACLVFTGDALTPELLSLADSLGISDRVRQVPDASDELLEA